MINRNMRLIVFFDLPVVEKRDRKQYAIFHKFLVKDGYSMLQYSVYSRVVQNHDDAKKYMLQRAREKQKRNKNRKSDSQIESLIVALVNAPEFKYDFESVLNLTIYQFNESVRQIIKRVDYNNRMFGVYSGTINAKEMSQDDLNWLVHK